jgi:mRNA interferase YafQ
MLALRRISQFKKDYKQCLKRGCRIERLHSVIELLVNSKRLDKKYKDHSLLGDYRDCRECHIEPDWLLVYTRTETELVLIRTGTHTDLFE